MHNGEWLHLVGLAAHRLAVCGVTLYRHTAAAVAVVDQDYAAGNGGFKYNALLSRRFSGLWRHYVRACALGAFAENFAGYPGSTNTLEGGRELRPRVNIVGAHDRHRNAASFAPYVDFTAGVAGVDDVFRAALLDHAGAALGLDR